MDVENLAKELILKNMTPEQQMAVLDSVRQSVLQAKEVQKKKIGENVDLVVQALKKIESDIRSRFESVGNSIEKRVLSIKDGRDGADGKDGRDGKDGKSGKDGLKGERGVDGQAGRDGVDGVDGISVVNANIDFDGSLVISLSDGREINVGEVVSADVAEKIKVISTMSTNAAIAVKEEGTTLTSGVKSLNFVGTGITATTSGDDVTVTVASGSGTVTSVAATAGTGISVSGSPITTSGTLTITNTAPDQTVVLTAGTGINTSGTYPSFTITNSSPDQTVALTQGGTTTITGTYPNFTISSADQFQGTVTSVSGTSPVASSGGATPAISLSAGYGDTQNPYASKTANFVLAAPNGSAGAPTFRAVVAADIPTLNQNTTGTASNVTGTVAIANGGTGQTTATAAFDALAPSQTSNSGKYLTTNGTTTSWATVSATGTVTSVAATVPAFLSVTGSPITTSGTLAISLSGTALPIANGGTAATSASAARTSLGLVIGTDVLAPNGSAASLTSFPTLNQNTTGSAATVTGNATGSTFGFNSGYGSVATVYGCRAWVNFNGTGTVAIRGSANVSSITDNGTGAYTVNFSTAMVDANYCTNVTGTHDGGAYVAWGTVANDTPPTTSAVRTDFLNNAGSPTDVSFAQVSIIR